MASYRKYRKCGDKWEYRIIYRDPITEKYKEKTKSGFHTKKEAQVEAADIEEKIYLGQMTIVKSRNTLVKSWLTEWLEVYNEGINAKTRLYRKHYINDILILRRRIPARNDLKNTISAVHQRAFKEVQKKDRPVNPLHLLHGHE